MLNSLLKDIQVNFAISVVIGVLLGILIGWNAADIEFYTVAGAVFGFIVGCLTSVISVISAILGLN